MKFPLLMIDGSPQSTAEIKMQTMIVNFDLTGNKIGEEKQKIYLNSKVDACNVDTGIQKSLTVKCTVLLKNA